MQEDLPWELDGPTNMLLINSCSSCGEEYSEEGREGHTSEIKHQ
jgi:hypothetical protein